MASQDSTLWLRADDNGKTASAAKAGMGQASTFDPDSENTLLSNYLLWILAIISGLLIAWRVTHAIVSYVRTVSSFSNDTQRYFAKTSSRLAWWKRNIQYSPMFSKRRNREFQLSSAVNMGTLPTRLQFVFLIAYLSTNVGFCVSGITFDNFSDATKYLRNRTGTLATVNMIPLFVMMGRNNPLIKWLGVSFDTFNLLHRWFGRIVAMEALAHVLAYLASAASEGGWGPALASMFASEFFLVGFVAVAAFLLITIQASSISRHAFYETFKIMHILLAAAAVTGLYYHLNLGQYSQLQWLIGAIVVWVAERTTRIARLVYNNVGSGGTKCLVEALPGNACRVTVTMARPWTFKPGQHAYLYMPAISLWQSHPFSVAWSEEAESLEDDKLAMNRQDILAMRKTTMAFVIRGRTGMTDTLWQRASAQPEGQLWTTCFAEGPYGGLHMMHSHGTAMLFAGGVGITHQVPHVRDLVTGYANGTVATRKIVLVWIIQSPEHLEWIRPWMTEILAMDKRRDALRIMLFVTRPRSTKEIHSPSATVQMFPGRPNIETLLAAEMEEQVGAMGVSVCGPGVLSDEVRSAVRKNQYRGNIDFVDEAFSW